MTELKNEKVNQEEQEDTAEAVPAHTRILKAAPGQKIPTVEDDYVPAPRPQSDEATVADEDKPTDETKKEWYVVNTYAGHENRVKENLEQRRITMGLEDKLLNIIVAEETEIDYKNGKKVEKVKNLYPGYIFVEMIMTDMAWYIVRNTPGVTGFIGSSGGGAKPFPVAQSEIEMILHKMGLSKTKTVVDFKVGQRVRIQSGPFANMDGTVDAMDDDNETAKVLIIMFGHETSTEVSYADLKKID
jgi:transcriptional antiterminator NusG